MSAWRLWLACQTQWRTSFGGIIGLDYTPMYSVAGSLGITIDAAILRKIQVLESDTLSRFQAANTEN